MPKKLEKFVTIPIEKVNTPPKMKLTEPLKGKLYIESDTQLGWGGDLGSSYFQVCLRTPLFNKGFAIYPYDDEDPFSADKNRRRARRYAAEDLQKIYKLLKSGKYTIKYTPGHLGSSFCLELDGKKGKEEKETRYRDFKGICGYLQIYIKKIKKSDMPEFIPDSDEIRYSWSFSPDLPEENICYDYLPEAVSRLFKQTRKKVVAHGGFVYLKRDSGPGGTHADIRWYDKVKDIAPLVRKIISNPPVKQYLNELEKLEGQTVPPARVLPKIERESDSPLGPEYDEDEDSDDGAYYRKPTLKTIYYKIPTGKFHPKSEWEDHLGLSMNFSLEFSEWLARDCFEKGTQEFRGYTSCFLYISGGGSKIELAEIIYKGIEK